MKNLDINLKDHDLEDLRGRARARDVDPSHLNKAQLSALLAADNPAKSTDAGDPAARRSALMKMQDLWSANVKDDIEGVDYQKAMRGEWS